MIVMPAIDNVAITKENIISAHRDRIVDRDSHARYANTMLDYLFPVLYFKIIFFIDFFTTFQEIYIYNMIYISILWKLCLFFNFCDHTQGVYRAVKQRPVSIENS